MNDIYLIILCNMNDECFPCQHNIVASLKCTPLLMNKIIERFKKYNRTSDKYHILLLSKLSPYTESYAREHCKHIFENDFLTYTKLVSMNRKDDVPLLARNHLHSKKNMYGQSTIKCSYCNKKFCEYHCIYIQLTHFKCTECDEFKSVCENCYPVCGQICKECDFDCTILNDIILYNDDYEKLNDDIEEDDIALHNMIDNSFKAYITPSPV